MLARPSISVLLAVRNGERFLSEAVNSLIRQSLPEFELIAINDGSTDAPEQILTEFAKRDPRITVHSQQWSGVVPSRNAAFARPAGEFIVLRIPVWLSPSFETTLASFTRQRSRWLKGILLHAWEMRARDQVCVVGIFHAVGVATVALPIASVFLGPSVLAMWLAGLSCANLNQVGYVLFLRCVADVDLPHATHARDVEDGPRDLLVLGYAALDLCLRGRARTW